MSDDMDLIPEREMKDFQFKQMKKIRIFESPQELPRERCSLLAVSNKYGLTFAGGTKELKVFATKQIIAANQPGGNPNEIEEGLKALCIPMKYPLHHIALSSDDLTLSVCTMSRECGVVIIFYDVRTFVNKDKPQKRAFAYHKAAAEEGCSVYDLKWNPTLPSLLAMCLSDGSLHVLEVTDAVKVQAQLPPSTGITSVCWSPKGKQVAAGKQDATVIQYSPTLQEKKVIPCPSFYSSDNPVKVLDVLWLSTYVFAVAYAAADGALETPPELVVVSLPKKDEKREERFLNFSDLFFVSCTERQHHYFLSHVEDWEIVLAASAGSIEVSIIAKQEDKTNWELWLLEDASRAELPVTLSNEDTLPVGVAIDYTSQVAIHISDEKSLPAAPVLMLLSTDGVLCPFYLINQNPGAKQLITPPGPLSIEGERQPKAGAASSPPPATSAPSACAVIPAVAPALRPPATTFSSPATAAAQTMAPVAFSFTSNPPSGSAFSLGPATSKPAGESSAAPLGMTTPIASFKTNSDPSTPPVKLNLADRFSAVETPAPSAIGSMSQFAFTSTPKPAFAGPVGQSMPLSVSVPVSAAKSNKMAALSASPHPAQNIAQSAAMHKPATAAPATVQSSLSVTASDKELQKRKASDPVMTGIFEEVAHFQKELDDLKTRTAKANFSVGTPEQMKELRQEAEDLHTFILEIKETTESLHGDISTLKTTLLEGFAGAEEAIAQSERNKDQQYKQLLYKKPLDPRSEAQLKEIRRLYQYAKFAVEDVNDVLDLEWDKHLETKKQRRLVVPERESLFNTLANNRDIISQQRQKLAQIVNNLQELRLYNKTSQWRVPSEPSTLSSDQGFDNELENLRATLLKASLETSPRAPSKSPAKMSPIKQSQLRNFLSKRQTPPVRSTAPANLSRSAFLSPKYFEDLDDASSTSSVSQALDPEDSQFMEPEDMMPVPRHPTVARTPSIQPGFVAQSSPLGKVQLGINPVLSPVLMQPNKKSGVGADSTALATKTVKHGAPPASERSPAATVTAQQAAAAAALRRHMTNQTPVGNTSLTESTLKTVPQVVNVQQLKGKGAAMPVSTVLSSSVPAPAAQAIQQVLATVATSQAKQAHNSQLSAVKASVPATSNTGFAFAGAPVKGETSTPVSATATSGLSSKAFSFTSAAPGGGLGFGALNTSSASALQAGAQATAKEPSQASKFSFSTAGSKPVFGSGTDGSFSFSTPKPAGGETSTATKPAVQAAALKTEAPPSKSGNGFFQAQPPGETLGSFSGLRVGQAEEEAKTAAKAASGAFSFAQIDMDAPGNTPSEFTFGNTFQMGKPADSTNTEAVSTTTAANPASVFGNIQVASTAGSTGVLKLGESVTPTTAFSIEQPSSTTALSSSTAPSFSSLLGTPAAFSLAMGDAKAVSPTEKPFVSAEPAPVLQVVEKTVPPPPYPAATAEESTVSSSTETAAPVDASAALKASEKPAVVPSEAAAVLSPITAPVPALASASTATFSTPAPVSTPSTEASNAPQSTLPAVPQQQPSVFGQSPSIDKPASVFVPTPSSTETANQTPTGLPQSVTAAAPVTTHTTSAPTAAFGQPPGITAAATASSGFSGPGFGSGSGFGKPAFGQPSGFGQPASSSANNFSFGQSAFGSTTAFGQPAAATPPSGNTGLFGSSSTSSASSFSFVQTASSASSSTGGGPFGQNTAPAFGQNSGFGQNASVFGGNTTTTSSSGLSFGQSSGFGPTSNTSVFGQQSNGGSVFGQQQASSGGGLFGSGSGNGAGAGGGGGGGGFFSGLGGKPSEDAANKNPFGVATVGGFGQTSQPGANSLFGNSGAKGFGSSSFGEKPSGTFSTGASSVAAQGFGSFTSPAKTGGFGAAPVFGSPPAFGSSPSFGGSPAFGSAPAFSSPLGSTGGKVFGEGTAAASAGGFGFASATNAPTFGSLASQNAPSFGNLAQQGSGFGGQQSAGFTGFGSTAGAFGSSGFSSSNQSSQSLGGWRS
ncbi:nuclear pore complex protein Nup214 [Polyodon spathula]|uniref:nuclear pore complex protein Nup214 n=1 Tax=Polyodon spathula TaxID=7913 RepID=UPI001B7EA701|nr:nuclear pore complex protein Nup214 [Polyodon spathula]